jgi:cytoskeleton protein RodZ
MLGRTLAAGEAVQLDGALPLRVKIGNASATQLRWRGQAVDLATWTRDNVARVELK